VPISVVVQDARGGPPTADDAALWAEQLQLSFPVLADPTGEFFEAWDPAGILPTSTIIDRDGVITWTEAGGAGGLERIEAEILTLLGD
jgi:hypothetical protein